MSANLELLVRLIEIRDTMKRLLGDQWPPTVDALGKVLTGSMTHSGETNVLAAVIPVAKAMSANGDNPLLLIAVAVEMAQFPSGCHDH